MHVKQYLEMLDQEIDALIEKESHKLTSAGEDGLYVLLENYKNVKHWKEMMHEHEGHAEMDNPMNPRRMAKNPY